MEASSRALRCFFLPDLRLSRRCSWAHRSIYSKRRPFKCVRRFETSAASQEEPATRAWIAPLPAASTRRCPEPGPANTARPQRSSAGGSARRSPSQAGVVQMTRSITTNKARVGSLSVEPACWRVKCRVRPGCVRPLCTGTCCTSRDRHGKARRLDWAEALLGQTQPGQPLKTARQRCARASGSLFAN